MGWQWDELRMGKGWIGEEMRGSEGRGEKPGRAGGSLGGGGGRREEQWKTGGEARAREQNWLRQGKTKGRESGKAPGRGKPRPGGMGQHFCTRQLI